MAPAIGIVPAAGVGSRMWPYRAAKELIQVGYRPRESNGNGGTDPWVPSAAVEHVLHAMRLGG